MATWYDIKLAALKKMDPAVTSLAPTRNTKDYLNSIIPAANRGLQDLATAGKFIIKELGIMIPEITTVYLDEKLTQHNDKDITVDGPAAKSFYCEVSGLADIKIYVGEQLQETRKTTHRAGFEVVKASFVNEENLPVKIVFSGSKPYLFRNVAMYDMAFESDEEVWEYAKNRKFDLKKLTDDFFRLATQDVVVEGPEYGRYVDYFWEGDSTLVLPGLTQAVYKVHYYAYPQEITQDTPDDTVMALDPEVANLLPVYIASELYEDDDESKAYYFRQQYEEAKQRLIPTIRQGKSEFEDVWGWS